MKDILIMIIVEYDSHYLGLKLAEVTWSRKLSICLNERALCKVSRGLIVGVPSSPTIISTITPIIQNRFIILTTSAVIPWSQVRGGR